MNHPITEYKWKDAYRAGVSAGLDRRFLGLPMARCPYDYRSGWNMSQEHWYKGVSDAMKFEMT